jgi:hypothetical protein
MDFYKIKEDWDICKDLVVELEKDIEVFFRKPTTRKWGTLVRKKSKKIETIGKKIKKIIIKQRQDLESDYS